MVDITNEALIGPLITRFLKKIA